MTFVSRLQVVAERQPDAIALRSPSEQVTFAELMTRATALGAHLHALGAGRESIVGLCFDKSPDYVVALVGAWCAGAAFVPLDPKLPRERLALIARECALELVVAQPQHAQLFEGLGARTISLADVTEVAPPIHARPEDLAYVIYTSGSTGVPKGVLVEHRGLVPLLDAQIAAFQLDSRSRALLYLSTSFDASLSDIGTALLAGATLCFASDDDLQAGPRLLRTLAQAEISHLDLPPALLRTLDVEALPRSLRAIVIGGEAATPELVRRWAARVRVVNVYGPTEATICTSLCVCAPEKWDRPLLGQPVAEMAWRVLDSQGVRVPRGEPGELHLTGPGLARGYLRRPELTATRFFEHEGERVYRTGDRVVQHANGDVEFLGRVDRQVKLRGLLIEPEEIEAQLQRHPSVARAAVLKRVLPPSAPGGPNRSVLAAYVVPRGAAEAAALRSHLADVLPRWMLPQRFELLDALPRTVTGKVDFDALARRPWLASSELVRPSTDLEQRLCALWQRVLGVDGVGVTDDFFALGGDSIAVLELVAAADAEGIALNPTLIQQHPTIAEIAQHLAAGGTSHAEGAMSADALRADVALDEEWKRLARPCMGEAPPRDAPRSIFLTGATGFLGARLLAELLEHTDAELHCLVRARDEDEGRKRLNHSHSERVHVVLGALDQPRFGLSAQRWRALTEDVDTVVHCGAQVNVVLTYERLRPANVEGTREVLRLLAEGRRKRLHYVSTLSVFVATDRNRGRMDESDDLSRTRCVYGGYAQSKWAAEHLVRTIAPALGPTSIYRFGLVTGDTRDGRASPTDLLTLFLRGTARAGCVPEGVGDALRVDVTPVDYAAAAFARLALHESDRDGLSTFHIANPKSLRLGALVDAMRAFGLDVRTVPLSEWRARLSADSGAFLALCRGLSDESFERLRTLDLFQATDADFGLERTTALLAAHGLSCPEPSPELLATYLRSIFVSS